MIEYKTTYNKSYALVAAVDEYAYLDSLTNAVRGANAVAEIMETNFDFEVSTLFNGHADRESILGWFNSLQCHSDDRVFFYFAGHGLTRKSQSGEIGYLALQSTAQGQYQTALSMENIIQEIEILAAKHVLMILDACFSGLALTRTRSAEFLEETKLQQFVDMLITRPVRYAITAGGVEVVDDNAAPDGQYSLFTHYLIRGLEGNIQTPGHLLRAKELANYLEENVGKNRYSRHKPNHGHLPSSGDGDFVFSRPFLPSSTPTDSKQCIILDPKKILRKEENDISILQHLDRTAKLTILEQITIGQSGSGVYLVDATGHNVSQLDGLYYCKIYRTATGEEPKINEIVSKTRIGGHVPKLVDSTPYINGWMASLYAVANETTLRGSQSLSNLITKNMLAANDSIRKLIELLENWNSPSLSRENSSPHTLLLSPLQRYLLGSEIVNQDITTRIMSLVDDMTTDIREIQFGKKVLPNPLAYLASDELWEKSRHILWPSGHIHGDLHTNNIICPLDQKLGTISGHPVIIDFDTYESDSCIFFDLAYLEIDLAMRMLPPAKPMYQEAWPKISEFLSREIQLPPIPPIIPESFAFYSLLIPIRDAVTKICKTQPGDFEVAFWIARASAGLSFARKRKISSAERMLVLLLAAESLEKALEELEIEQKQTQQPIWIRWFD